jgi:hypothetical protein
MSIHNTTPQFEKHHVPRFHRLDTAHISAIESLYEMYPFLNSRMEIHMPFARAKPTFSSGTVWVWPKFDKRPVGYLIFMEGFAPCIWYPERQEGMTFRWLLPPTFSHRGVTICLANILSGESLLQMEDIVIQHGKDLWSTLPFSERWTYLREFWASLPPDQPLLAFKPQVVSPIPLEKWTFHYDPAIYWIIQPDHARQARWYWKDTVTERHIVQYVAPVLKRAADTVVRLYAYCAPYTKLALPDTYSLFSQEGDNLGMASIATLGLSQELRKRFLEGIAGLSVEVKWNDSFRKYQIVSILPEDTPLTTSSFFYHKNL